MDEGIKELIAIGVSIGVHCQPCLAFHLEKAKELGIGEEDIQEAIQIGHMVEQGATTAMKKYERLLLGQTQAPSGPCCSGNTSSQCCG